MTPQWQNKKGRGIEWCDYTNNPVGGCLHECKWEMPDGVVVECYAKDIAEGYLGGNAYPQGFAHHYWRPNMLKTLKANKTASLVFGNSMSDMFGHWVPEAQVMQCLETFAQVPHTIMLLTKNSPKILHYLPHIPKNVWLGVSSSPDYMWGKPLTFQQQKAMLMRQMDVLATVAETHITWMSIEPLSWPIANVLGDNHPLRWAVIGAGTNGRKKYQPEAQFVQDLIDLFDSTSTPVFFKGNLEWLPRREDFPVVAGYGDTAVLNRQENAKKYNWPQNRYITGAAQRHNRELLGDNDPNCDSVDEAIITGGLTQMELEF